MDRRPPAPGERRFAEGVKAGYQGIVAAGHRQALDDATAKCARVRANLRSLRVQEVQEDAELASLMFEYTVDNTTAALYARVQVASVNLNATRAKILLGESTLASAVAAELHIQKRIASAGWVIAAMPEDTYQDNTLSKLIHLATLGSGTEKKTIVGGVLFSNLLATALPPTYFL